jgi:hypothetical protein
MTLEARDCIARRLLFKSPRWLVFDGLWKGMLRRSMHMETFLGNCVSHR